MNTTISKTIINTLLVTSIAFFSACGENNYQEEETKIELFAYMTEQEFSNENISISVDIDEKKLFAASCVDVVNFSSSDKTVTIDIENVSSETTEYSINGSLPLSVEYSSLNDDEIYFFTGNQFTSKEDVLNYLYENNVCN